MNKLTLNEPGQPKISPLKITVSHPKCIGCCEYFIINCSISSHRRLTYSQKEIFLRSGSLGNKYPHHHYCILLGVYLLPPANEVWGKVIFLHLSVILFTGGSTWACTPLLEGTPPGMVHSPGQVQ